MSETTLSYLPIRASRPSAFATVSLWLGGSAILLFVLAIALHRLIVAPAYSAMDPGYYRYKMLLVIVPAWSSFGLALVGFSLAITGLFCGKSSRFQAICGLVLCLMIPVLMMISG